VHLFQSLLNTTHRPLARGAALGLPAWLAQITRSGAVPNDDANDQAVVHTSGYEHRRPPKNNYRK
jgi:hypothetical protein